MIKTGINGTIFTAAWVHHELSGDIEKTVFSINHPITEVINEGNKKKEVIVRLPDSKPLVVYYWVTVWENVPLVNGDNVKLLYMNNFKPFYAKSKKGQRQLYYSFSAKIEVVEKKQA